MVEVGWKYEHGTDNVLAQECFDLIGLRTDISKEDKDFLIGNIKDNMKYLENDAFKELTEAIKNANTEQLSQYIAFKRMLVWVISTVWELDRKLGEIKTTIPRIVRDAWNEEQIRSWAEAENMLEGVDW